MGLLMMNKAKIFRITMKMIIFLKKEKLDLIKRINPLCNSIQYCRKTLSF